MYKVPNFQLIELIIPATVTGALQQTFFQSQPQLQSYDGGEQVYVKSIQTYTNKSLIFSPLTSGIPVASAVDIANAVINFSINGKLRMQYLPLARLNLLNDNTGGDPSSAGWPFLLRDIFKVDWTKTYITTIVAPGASGTTAPPFSYFIGVDYGYCPDAEDLADNQVINAYATKQVQKGNGNANSWKTGGSATS